MCSHGLRGVRDIFDDSKVYAPFCAETSGTIFTRLDPDLINTTGSIKVTRPWQIADYPEAICISGDKGDAAALFEAPCLLFDDKELNLDRVLAKGAPGSNGVLVRTGDNAYRRVEHRWHHRLSYHPEIWPDIVKGWGDRLHIGH